MTPAPPRLLLVTDREAIPELEGAVSSALAGGVGHVLLREKGVEGRVQLERARVMLGLCQAHGAALLVHGRVDLALSLEGVGLHQPEEELPTAVARSLLGPRRLLGRSCHDLAGARRALEEGADYVTLSPLFATRTHPAAVPMGLERFSALCRELPGAVLGLGGITADNAAQVMAAGAYGVAMIRGLLEATDPAQAARRLRLIVDRKG